MKLMRRVVVVVAQAPFANTRSVAELVLAEMIMLARQAGDRNNELHKKIWNKVSAQRVVGVVGAELS
jgi:D-3-phosphoglycerate dehydrogenase